MAFTVRDFHDLVALLEAHPEWQAELRRLLLPGELLELPTLARELVLAQQRTEARLEALADRVNALTASVEALTEAQLRTQATVATLVKDVGRLKGLMLEMRYQDRAHNYFRPLVARGHALTGDELNALFDEALASGALSDQEIDVLSDADLIVLGQQRQ